MLSYSQFSSHAWSWIYQAAFFLYYDLVMCERSEHRVLPSFQRLLSVTIQYLRLNSFTTKGIETINYGDGGVS
jgi:hypothetical protein